MTEQSPAPAGHRRNAAAFLFSSVCSFIANGIFIYMYVITADAATGRSAFTGLVLTAIFLPLSLGALFSGAIADRMPRRPILILCAFGLSLVAAASSAVLASTGQAPETALLLLALLFGIATAPVYGSRLALVGDIAPPEKVGTLFVLLNVANTASFGLGPFTAGFLVETATPAAALGVSAALYVAAAFSLFAVRLQPSRGPEAGASRLRVVRDTWEGLRSLLANRRIGFHLVTTAITSTIILGSVQALFPRFADEFLNLGDFARAASYAAFAVGLTLGGLTPALTGPIAPTTARLLSPCLVAAAFLSLCAFYAGAAGSSLALAVSGYALGIRGSMIPLALQREAPGSHRGRLMSAYAAIMNGGPIVGGVGFGLVADSADVRWALGLAGLAAFAGALLALLHPGARRRSGGAGAA